MRTVMPESLGSQDIRFWIRCAATDTLQYGAIGLVPRHDHVTVVDDVACFRRARIETEYAGMLHTSATCFLIASHCWYRVRMLSAESDVISLPGRWLRLKQ